MERKKPSKTKKSLKNMTREQLQEALQRKKEGNARALQIVESFTDFVPTEEEFLSKLFDLNQSHYQDIVEERAILKKCGYTLCDRELGRVPHKQYHISTLHNRVFDITERKNFCSNNCFKSSNYVKDQMLTSPLWMRDTEKIPDFKLLSQAVSCKDLTGHEVDLGPSRVKPDDIEKPAEEKDETTLEDLLSDMDHVISFGKPTQQSKNCDTKFDKNVDIENKSRPPPGSSDCKESDENSYTSNQTTEMLKEEENNKSSVENDAEMPLEHEQKMEIDVEKPGMIDQHVENSKHISPSPSTSFTEVKSKTASNLAKEIIENKTSESKLNECLQDNKRKDNRELHNSNIMKKSKPTCENAEAKDKKDNLNKALSKPTCENAQAKNDKENLNKAVSKILALESNLKQWTSVDTLILLLGEAVVQNVLVETNKHYKQHAEVMKQLNATDEPQMNQLLGKHKDTYDRYSALCKKLNMLEIADEAEDSRLRGEDARVKAEVEKPQAPVPNYEELRRQTEEMMIVVDEFYKGDKRKVTFAEGTSEDKAEDEESPPVILPPVDLHAQKALRRKILLDKLIKIIPEVLRLLGASHLSLSSELRTLVRTFNLTAHNVMVQAAEWTLIAVVLLKMLAINDVYLSKLLGSEQSRKHLTLICLSYGLDLGYLDRLQAWLLEPHHVIAASMTS